MLDRNEVNQIKKQNPLLVKKFSRKVNNKYINLRDFIKTDILDYDVINLDIINPGFYMPIIYFNFIMNLTYLEALKLHTLGQVNKSNIIKYTNATSEKYGLYNEINCIINSNNCGYNFVENYEDLKLVVWILPYNEKTTYLRNILDLKKEHLNMLYELKQIYMKKGYTCFVHLATTFVYGLLHFHVIKYDEYRRIYPKDKKGTYILREINLDNLINNISINESYYQEFDISILNVRI
jgi:hypothetical protein